MEVAILLALILLNGVFAMSEIALVSARRGRLQAQADAGDKGAAAAIELNLEPTRFLSTVQIGITAIGILNGIIGEAVLARPVAMWLREWGVPPTTADYAATATVVLVITYLSIVLGELVPKRLGQMSPEAVARRVARPLKALASAAKPFVRLLSGSTQLVLRIFGAKERHDSTMVEEEIHALLLEGSDAGVIEESEHAMVRNVFRLDDRLLGSLMVPRNDIVSLDVNKPWSENQAIIAGSYHSRFPVLRGGMQDIVGVVSARSLLGRCLRGEAPDLVRDAAPAVFVPETLTGMELLENFRASGGQLVFVVDEYGEVQGMVTLSDVMEAITGEFKPRLAEDAWAVQREDGSWLLDGLIPVPELKDRLRLQSVPEEERGGYHTLSGMLMLQLGRLPQTADSLEWDGWHFEIVDMDGKRIDKVLAKRATPGPGPAP